MSGLSLVCYGLCAMALYGMWVGFKVMKKLWSYRLSKDSAPRVSMRETNMRVRLDQCPGEYCVLDMSSSGMAVFIDHFADGFHLAKRTKFIIRNLYGENVAKLVSGKVVYLKQLSHGYRLGVQFDEALDERIIEAFQNGQNFDHIEAEIAGEDYSENIAA